MSISPTWEISGGGEIDPVTGFFTANVVGNWSVYANYSGISGHAKVTITHGTLVKLTLEPATVTLNVSDTLTFNVIGFDADNNQWRIEPSSVSWSSSAESVGTIDQSGNFKALAPGTTTITASLDDISVDASVSVSAIEPIEEEVEEEEPGKRAVVPLGAYPLVTIIVVLVAVIVVIAILILIFMGRKRKRKEKARVALLVEKKEALPREYKEPQYMPAYPYAPGGYEPTYPPEQKHAEAPELKPAPQPEALPSPVAEPEPIPKLPLTKEEEEELFKPIKKTEERLATVDDAMKAIEAVRTQIAEAYERGVDATEIEALFHTARLKMEEGDYAGVLEICTRVRKKLELLPQK